ncbi:uncharacterized protein J3D65DRAFT_603386 [Phyllosticta citribraziliensis]|uniref:Uncharacterized protein n=1 Tax=Phyllosticta citribraziliensis TaxID=989973 RepID=A0ABR1LQE7_9PEZI
MDKLRLFAARGLGRLRLFQAACSCPPTRLTARGSSLPTAAVSMRTLSLPLGFMAVATATVSLCLILPRRMAIAARSMAQRRDAVEQGAGEWACAAATASSQVALDLPRGKAAGAVVNGAGKESRLLRWACHVPGIQHSATVRTQANSIQDLCYRHGGAIR